MTRNDDSRATVEKRLSVYKSQTEPLINYYSELGLLETVNGHSDPIEVYAEIASKLEGIGKNQR